MTRRDQDAALRDLEHGIIVALFGILGLLLILLGAVWRLPL